MSILMLSLFSAFLSGLKLHNVIYNLFEFSKSLLKQPMEEKELTRCNWVTVHNYVGRFRIVLGPWILCAFVLASAFSGHVRSLILAKTSRAIDSFEQLALSDHQIVLKNNSTPHK